MEDIDRIEKQLIAKVSLPVKPEPKERARITSRGNFTPDKTVAAEQEIAYKFKEAVDYVKFDLDPSIAFFFRVIFYRRKPRISLNPKYPVERPDKDNYEKTLLDALESIVFFNDGQVCGSDAWKLFGKPRIELEIYKLP